MIEVLPIQSKTEQEALCARCGIKYKPETMAYFISSQDGSAAAISQFKMSSGTGYIEDIAAAPNSGESFDNLFVLGRATLNFIDLCGVHEAYYTGGSIDDTLLRAIGFSKNSDGRYFVNMTELFKSPCGHK